MSNMDYDLQRILPQIACRQLYLARCFIQKGLSNNPHVIWSSCVTYLASYNSPHISNGISLCRLVNMPDGSTLRENEQTGKTKHFSEAHYNGKHDKNAPSFHTCRNAATPCTYLWDPGNYFKWKSNRCICKCALTWSMLRKHVIRRMLSLYICAVRTLTYK